jgi:hemoglobin
MNSRFAPLIAALILLPGLAGAEQRASTPTLYARLGGYDALAAVTDDFLGRLSGDLAFGKFFSSHSTDSLKRIRQLIVDQLCAATGGPCVYIGRDMKTAHAGLGISEGDWTAMANHLTATFDRFKVPQKERDEVFGALGGLKKDIVEKP